MAVSPIVPLVPVDEYPESSYRPEMEYVDGFLVERGMPTIAHGLLQMILGSHFRLFRQQFSICCYLRGSYTDCGTRRHRVPDVILCPLPLPAGKIVTSAPS